ncbi:hypothetical protein JVT61DRAFT_5587 [Boletus reticuloceps]|uniref:Uncharacterized protein n=1 Tax=Boletus reticuloceps TaxID=495285 RepID=A0A8I3AG47_9AGAM|nr:hypothetical protein JVT61DRAFT_5587 [Boletus reticuloceps]
MLLQRRSHTIVFLLLSLFVSHVIPVQGSLTKWEATNFCKCICFQSNYSILQMDASDNPSKSCLSCTKQWCLDQRLGICDGATLGDTDPDTATGKEGDVEARCFQRDSPRDQLVVTLFLLTVFGLLLGAGIKNRMLKAGMDPNIPWLVGRRWWEEWVPHRHLEEYHLREHIARPPDDRGEYREVSETLPT